MDPTLMYGAVQNGQVQAIIAYTTDGRILAFELEVLEDPRQAFPPYEAVLLLSSEAAQNVGLRQALEPLVGAISLESMRQANRRVDLEEWTARHAGRELLHEIAREP